MNNIGFDLDGTLFDTENSVKKSLELALNHNFVNADLSNFELGPPLDIVLSKLNIPKNIHSIIKESFIEIYDHSLCTTCKPLFELEELFSHIEKYKVFIITNKRRLPAELILKKYNIFDSLSGLFCSDDSGFMNKSSTFTNNAIELYIGDSMDDFNQAKQAGIEFILCDWMDKYNSIDNRILDYKDIYQYI